MVVSVAMAQNGAVGCALCRQPTALRSAFTKPDLCSCFGTDACDLQVKFGCTSASPFPAALGHCSVTLPWRDCMSCNGSLPTAGLGEFVATCTRQGAKLAQTLQHASLQRTSVRARATNSQPAATAAAAPTRQCSELPSAKYNRCCYRWGNPQVKKAQHKTSCRHLTPHLPAPLPLAAAAPRRYRCSSCRDSC